MLLDLQPAGQVVGRLAVGINDAPIGDFKPDAVCHLPLKAAGHDFARHDSVVVLGDKACPRRHQTGALTTRRPFEPPIDFI
jgi:hypothetical protein